MSIGRATSSLRSAYEKLDQNPQFWYERASALTDKLLVRRPGLTEWKLIYILLENEITAGPIRSANTLRVLLEDLRMPFLQKYNIRSAEALEYLLNSNNTDIGLMRSAITRTAIGNEEEANKMLAVISRNKNSTGEMKHEVVEAAVLVGLTDNLLNLFDKQLVTKTASSSAVLSNNKKSVKYLLELHHPGKDEILNMIGVAISNNKLVSLSILLNEVNLTRAELSKLYVGREGMLTALVLEVLLNHGLTLEVGQWRTLLVSSIRSGTIELVELALKYIDPMTATNQSLVLALQKGSSRIVKLLLSDPRINPNVNLKAALRGSVYAEHKLLVVRHLRVELDRLDEEVLEIVDKALRSDRLTYPVEHPQEEFYNPSSTYWFIARFLLIKQPTAEQTLEYIRDSWMDKEEVREAVLSIFDWYMDYSYEAAPIRALLLFLIYPNMSITESEKYLRTDDEYPDELIDSSNFLIGLVRRT